MQEFNTGDYLTVEATCLLLRESVLPHDVVEEFAAARVLHDEKDARLRLNDLIQFDHVLVADAFQNFDLADDALYIRLVCNSGLF